MAALAGALGLLAAAPGAAGDETAAEADCPAGIEQGAALVVGEATLPQLEPLVPAELWEKREAFFFDGMRIGIAACQRDYPTPAFFRAATEAHAASAHLDAEGNLQGYVAGLPFPPASIEAGDPQAGAKWAWSFERRYRGAGPRGELVIHELVEGKRGSQAYSGNWYQHMTRHRADLAAADYRTAYGGEYVWVAGGRFRRPGAAANLAWRQFRLPRAYADYRDVDDIFVHVPNIRRVRRSATAWVQGLFVPRYTVSELSAGRTLGRDFDRRRPQDLAGAAPSEDIGHGLVGLVYRPNAFTWSVRETRDVLALLNAVDRPGATFDWAGYQKNEPGSHGPRGVAFDGERWDVRRAVVLEGVPKKPQGLVHHVDLWIDAETLHPLYVIERSSRGKAIQVGVLVHSFSGDAQDYPEFGEGVAAQVFDPVAAAFLATGPGGSTWRRESWGATSVPVSELDQKQMSSTTRLKSLP